VITVSDFRLSREKVEAAYYRMVQEVRELERHPNYPWIDEVPGYTFASDEMCRLEAILDDMDERGIK
jgi:hypothetical protein